MSGKSQAEMVEDFFKPEDFVADCGSCKAAWDKWYRGDMDGKKASKDHEPRGSVLAEAMRVINGERQDVYGAPERSFERIANYWTEYLGDQMTDRITPQDVAMMMTLFKVAREANQHKRDNIVDAAGYLGIYADMQEAE